MLNFKKKKKKVKIYVCIDYYLCIIHILITTIGIKLLNLPTLQWDYWKYKYNNNKDKV